MGVKKSTTVATAKRKPDCAPLGLLGGGVSLHWRDEKPDREGWWVCAAKKDNSLHIGFVT